MVRLIGQKPNRYPTQQLYKDERLLPLESLMYMELCRFGHRITTKELPKPLLDLLDSQGGRKTHQYETRNKKTPNIQKHSGIHFNKSFMCKGLTTYNQLSKDIKEMKNIKTLTHRIKKLLLQ